MNLFKKCLVKAFNICFVSTVICFALVCIPKGASGSDLPRKYRFELSALDLGSLSYGCVLQDKEGFIWFSAIGYGLLRYDGHELKRFPSSPHMLSGPMVSSIAEDKTGILWIATFSNGLTSYDKQTNQFVHHRHDPDDSNSISTDNMPFSPQILFVDRQNRIWTGSDNGGLNRYDQKTRTWTRFFHDPENLNSLSSNTVNAIVEDNDGAMWIGTTDGLNRFDPEKKHWAVYRHIPGINNSLGSNWISGLLKDRNGNIWVGTDKGGLSRYQANSDSFINYDHSPEKSGGIVENSIWNLYEDRNGRIWISHYASKTKGLEMFDPETNRFVHYANKVNDSSALSTISIRGVLEDRNTGVFFVINGNGVVDKYDPMGMDIEILRHDPENPGTISGNLVLPIIEDKEGMIWLGTGGDGLNRYDPATGAISRFLPEENSVSSLPNGYITALMQDSSGRIWVGSGDGHLSLFDPASGKVLKNFQNIPEDEFSITRSSQVKYILEDRDEPDVLWIATVKGGVDRFHAGTGKFFHYKHEPGNPNGLSVNTVVSLYDDGAGKIWMATYGGGLDILEKKSRTFTRHVHDPKNPASINSNSLYEIFKDSRGRTWITGKGGISLFDTQSGTFTNFSKQTGLASNVIPSILEDSDGNFWLGTIDKGLIRFNPDTGKSKLYSQ